MNFSISHSVEILERTPEVLIAMLKEISKDWTNCNEGPDTWSVFDVVGHLIHGEKTDWIPRSEIMLSDKADKTFEPFDRFAQFRESEGKTLNDLLIEFKSLRQKNLEYLRLKNLSTSEFEVTGIHPEFGDVTLSQLIAAWTVHDLEHIAQISRIMSKQYKSEVGPWSKYLKVLN